jgi:hypothetical protein
MRRQLHLGPGKLNVAVAAAAAGSGDGGGSRGRPSCAQWLQGFSPSLWLYPAHCFAVWLVFSLYVRLCSCSLVVVYLISFLLLLYGLLHVWLTIVRCMASRFAHCLLYVCLSLTLSCSLLAVWLLLLAAIAKLLDVAVAALLADLPLLLLLAALQLLLSLINC